MAAVVVESDAQGLYREAFSEGSVGKCGWTRIIRIEGWARSYWGSSSDEGGVNLLPSGTVCELERQYIVQREFGLIFESALLLSFRLLGMHEKNLP